jgi:superfamily II DNA or RNA helicase
MRLDPARYPALPVAQPVSLRDYQESLVADVRAAFSAGQSCPLLVAPTGAGKCLARGTPVLMFDGTIRPVESIVVGDLLMGPDSAPRRVESLARGREAMYRVTPTKGDSYVVNESHILSLKITRMGCKFVSGPNGEKYSPGDIVNICLTDYLRASKTFKHVAKGWRSPVNFQPSSAHLKIPAYILGAWLGDGTTGKLSFTTGDDEMLDELKLYAECVGMRLTIEENSPGSVVAHMVSDGRRYGRGGSPIGNALREAGVFREKRVPHSYKVASRYVRLQLLAGVLDTDGYYDGKGYSLTLKSELLLDDILFVARSLGFACYKKKISKTCTNNGVEGEYYACHINGGIDEIPCRLPRKKAGPRRQKKNVLVHGIGVELVGIGDYFGFEISGNDRLFLLGDFTVTHNTVMFSYIARNAANLGRRVLILAHRDTLIKQSSAKLRDYGVEHGVIMAGFTPQHHCRVQVASVQTIVRRLDKLPYAFDLVVIDEAHLSAAKSYITIVEKLREKNPKMKLLGVTGSPVRLDGKGLGRHAGGLFDVLLQGLGPRDLIDQAYLVQPTVYAPAEQIDLSQVKKVGGDYESGALAEVMDRPKITGSAIDAWRKHCPGVPAVAWCANVAHAQHVAAEFTAAGIPALALSGDDDGAERERALAGLANGSVKVITFAMLLVEGVDCPAIGAVIMLRPTMSLSSYLQVIGRGLRTIYAPGMPIATVEQRRAAILAGPKGPKCFVLDHAGLTFKHGFADDDTREWSLDGVTKKKGKKKVVEEGPPVAQCPKCYHVHVKAPVCPACGHTYEARGGSPEHVDGELAEITPEMRVAMAAARKTEIKKAKTLEDLLRIENERGYKPGWAAATHTAKARIRDKYRRPEPPLSVYENDFSR